MREIKFRGKRKDNGEWITGYLIKSYKNEYKIGKNIADEGYYFTFFEVIPETVGQYIGITDINNQDIYEDDIVDIFHSRTNDNLGRLLVKWNNAFMRFDFSQQYFERNPLSNWTCEHILANFKLKIVGNIYDNKDLLKEL